MRIAFLTPEHPADFPDGGGLGSYLDRMTRSLVEAGHVVEIFLASPHRSETIHYDGALLHRVNPPADLPRLDRLRRSGRSFCPDRYWFPYVEPALRLLVPARALARALERRHAAAPFQLVQSSDWGGIGMVVRRRPERRHVVRCSCGSDLYHQADGHNSLHCTEFLERYAMRRADAVYAPSRYIAAHFQNKHGIDVQIIRPPARSVRPDLQEPAIALPDRFLLHFGQLIDRKGTALLAEALTIAWEKAPDLTMVWSGNAPDKAKLEQWRSQWGQRRDQVHITGPLRRPQMYAVLQRAEAAVLPSQVDNLPNTVIESLISGVPVIGTRGASIDELVEDGRTGHLVALGDVRGLAEALVTMWLRRSPVAKGFAWRSEVGEEMRPARAVANLISLATPGRLAAEDARGAAGAEVFATALFARQGVRSRSGARLGE